MNYRYALNRRDIVIIDKLNGLSNKATFWDDVRNFTKKITSDNSIGRWQCLAEIRYKELAEN